VNKTGDKQTGLTLLEMLVVFLLVALLSTLLIQGVGYFLGQYQAVQRFQGRVYAGLTSYTWFSECVEAMIPYEQSTKQFRGDEYSFTGTSMQALGAEPGIPVEVSWTIVAGEVTTPLLQYREEGQLAWDIPAQAGAATFEYADSKLGWHKNWPPENEALALVPKMVRLMDEQQKVIWLVNLMFYPQPVEDGRAPGLLPTGWK